MSELPGFKFASGVDLKVAREIHKYTDQKYNFNPIGQTSNKLEDGFVSRRDLTETIKDYQRVAQDVDPKYLKTLQALSKDFDRLANLSRETGETTEQPLLSPKDLQMISRRRKGLYGSQPSTNNAQQPSTNNSGMPTITITLRNGQLQIKQQASSTTPQTSTTADSCSVQAEDIDEEVDAEDFQETEDLFSSLESSPIESSSPSSIYQSGQYTSQAPFQQNTGSNINLSIGGLRLGFQIA